VRFGTLAPRAAAYGADMRLTLRDGTAIDVRPIRPDDKPLLAVGLHRLSPETVEKRFLAPKTSFTRSELRYLTEVDGHDHVAYVASEAGDPAGLVAVARLVRLAGQPRDAEAAIVVADPFQGRGLGRALALMLADAARERGIDRIHGTFRGDNVPAQKLMAAIAARLLRTPPSAGTVELTAELAA
jgi:RimJ/RimL family protein N-acetyltransferase